MYHLHSQPSNADLTNEVPYLKQLQLKSVRILRITATLVVSFFCVLNLQGCNKTASRIIVQGKHSDFIRPVYLQLY